MESTPVKPLIQAYDWLIEKGDRRVENWLLLKTPIPITIIFLLYLTIVVVGPKIMASRPPISLNPILIPYNFALVVVSVYMFYELVVTSVLSNYSYICEPVDYSNNPLALRMASVCWWFFFTKVVELLDTVFFILRKKNSQITFLHVYHHCTMIINWWAGAKYIAGGQSWFVAMCNSFVHIFMYTYYFLTAFGPEIQKYLWWKKYLTTLQLTQFVLMAFHTTVNIVVGCDFPQGFNYAVVAYAISLIILFGNFYWKTYDKKPHKKEM